MRREKKQFYENFVKFWKLEQLKFREIEIEQKNLIFFFPYIVGKNPKSLDQTLLDELDRYKEAHKVASESNQTLHKAMRLHLTNLKTLNKPLSELQTDIPSTADLDAEAEASIGKKYAL